MKIFYPFSMLLILHFQTVFSQTDQLLWAKKGSGTSQDYFNSMSTDGEGNTYQVGSFNSKSVTFGNFELKNSGIRIFYIVKYDESGQVKWAHAGHSSPNAISGGTGTWCDKEGHVYATGYFNDSITIGNKKITDGPGSMFLAKFNADGKIIWTKSFSYAWNTYLINGISGDQKGNIFLSGIYSADHIILGDTILKNVGSAGSQDIFLMKCDTSGNVKWTRNITGGSIEQPRSISADTNGNVYVGGTYFSYKLHFGNTVLTNYDSTDFKSDGFIAKYNTLGKLMWAKNCGSAIYDDVNDINALPDGSAIVTGSFSGSVLKIAETDIEGNGSCANTFLIKFNPSGKIAWSKSFGNSNNNNGLSTCTDKDGNIYLGGDFFHSIILDDQSFTNSGFVSSYIIKFDKSGKQLHALKFGGDYWDKLIKLSTDDKNNLYVGGDFSSAALHFGNGSLGNTTKDSSTDTFIAKIMFKDDRITSVQENGAAVPGNIIFPNPISSSAIVTLSKDFENAVLTITDIVGTRVKSIQFSGNQLKLEKDGMPAGVYYLQINSGSKVLLEQKIVVE